VKLLCNLFYALKSIEQGPG